MRPAACWFPKWRYFLRKRGSDVTVKGLFRGCDVTGALAVWVSPNPGEAHAAICGYFLHAIIDKKLINRLKKKCESVFFNNKYMFVYEHVEIVPVLCLNFQVNFQSLLVKVKTACHFHFLFFTTTLSQHNMTYLASTLWIYPSNKS